MADIYNLIMNNQIKTLQGLNEALQDSNLDMVEQNAIKEYMRPKLNSGPVYEFHFVVADKVEGNVVPTGETFTIRSGGLI